MALYNVARLLRLTNSEMGIRYSIDTLEKYIMRGAFICELYNRGKQKQEMKYTS